MEQGKLGYSAFAGLAEQIRPWQTDLMALQIIHMLIIWDEPKRQSNMLKHGLDFAELSEAFFLASYTEPARQGRILAIGDMNGVLVVSVVYRALGTEAVSVISMRRANPAERSRAHG